MARVLLRVLLGMWCGVLWSIQGGAAQSDNPLLQPESQAKQMRFVDKMEKLYQYPRTELLSFLKAVRYVPSAVAAVVRPPASKRVLWTKYRDLFLTVRRIQGGLDFWQEHQATLQRAERVYGVPAQIIVAIIGIETSYGKNQGSYRTADVLASLAFSENRRAEFFEQELMQFLLLVREQAQDWQAFFGSYAGALGVAQFLPSSHRHYAVDFDQNGRISLSTMGDAIGSVAAYLQSHGWKPGKPIAQPIQFAKAVPESLLAGGIRPILYWSDLLPIQPSLAAGEVKPKKHLPFALLGFPVAQGQEQYWLGFENFYVITRYNQSRYYALAVFQLAQRLRSGMDL